MLKNIEALHGRARDLAAEIFKTAPRMYTEPDGKATGPTAAAWQDVIHGSMLTTVRLEQLADMLRDKIWAQASAPRVEMEETPAGQADR